MNLNAALNGLDDGIKRINNFFKKTTAEDYRRMIYTAISAVSSDILEKGNLIFFKYNPLNADSLFKNYNPAALDVQ